MEREITTLDLEDCAKEIMEGRVSNEQWRFAFNDWQVNTEAQDMLVSVLHRWNTNMMVYEDEEYFETIVLHALEAACIFKTGQPLQVSFPAIDLTAWVRDFSSSLYIINLGGHHGNTPSKVILAGLSNN